MNIHAMTSAALPVSSEEWHARVELAAVYRLVAHHGWDDAIYNHCSLRVPGENRMFLMKRHELLWTEVGRGSADWPAYLRLLDRLDPSYRT